MPDEKDPKLIEGISKIRAHLSEVYRLHRRILRHRRRSIRGLTPKRSGADVVRYRSADRAALTEAIDDWRFNEAVALDELGRDDLWKARADVFGQVLERASQYPSSGPGMIGFLAQKPSLIGDQAKFRRIKQCMAQTNLSEDRVEALIEALISHLDMEADFVVFCSDPATADTLAARIEGALPIAVLRHRRGQNRSDIDYKNGRYRVIVCDRTSEEGLNLQGSKKIVVHYDLPFNPNRIEQRLGRIDRYGTTHSVHSIVLVCEDDPIESAWFEYLNNALKIFERSVASLQYLVDETMKGIRPLLFTEGASAIFDLAAQSAGDRGVIALELKSIDAQDALDALGAPPTDVVDDLIQIDRDWALLEEEAAPWFEKGLRFRRREESAAGTRNRKDGVFHYIYAKNEFPTTVPRHLIWNNCKGSVYVKWKEKGDYDIRTVNYSYSRSKILEFPNGENGVFLLRYGEPFIDGVAAIAECHEFCRSFSVWRLIDENQFESDGSVAEVYFRFDFVVEVDLDEAFALLRRGKRDGASAFAAVQRRGDMAFRPICCTLWLDRELNRVLDAHLIEELARPYHAEKDIDLSQAAREGLKRLDIPELGHWAEICARARDAALVALRADTDFADSIANAERRAMDVDHGRLGQLLARSRSSQDPYDENELAFETSLAAALRNGILEPKVRVDSVGAIFASTSMAATERVRGGQ
jgi:ATP-dependent helicase HepA